MRGKRHEAGAVCGAVRFIPAHAGKTHTEGTWCPHRSVHPRACGENPRSRRRLRGLWGSSPRMRGKLPNPNRLRRLHGFIPAHAGKTTASTSRPRPARVHPRACGENEPVGDLAQGRRGSSPRMRGKPRHLVAGQRGERFIPAHAGKTRVGARRPVGAPVHPRACGENCFAVDEAGLWLGSSPRMRGKRPASEPAPPLRRFIPAHAGKT